MKLSYRSLIVQFCIKYKALDKCIVHCFNVYSILYVLYLNEFSTNNYKILCYIDINFQIMVIFRIN